MIGANTIAQIVQGQWSEIRKQYNRYELRILDAIRRCRTASLGGHIYVCKACKRKHYRYNSCRNRHCSQCQHTQKEQWIEARDEQYLEGTYYHLVFTLPQALNELCMVYSRELYTILMQTAWQTIESFGWNHKYIGAQTGATIVLHTWGSNLSFHPHVHCIVPGGGISLQGKWKVAKGKGKFLFPVKGLSKKFRGLYMQKLKAFCQLQGLDKTEDLYKALWQKSWVVYAKPSFGGQEGIIRYLARYAYNVAISNHRILKADKQEVTFRYKDYRHGNRQKVMTLSAWEFVRRLTMHFLPKGFCRIRHYGILSSAWKKRLFGRQQEKEKITWEQFWKNKGLDVYQCPNCKKGRLIYIGQIEPVRGPPVYSKSKKSASTF